MHDVVVLGGGPAGVVAALRARELGASVALVERNRFGGTCTNDGCVPTRVLAKAARLVRDAHQFAEYGLTECTVPVADFARLMEKVRQVVEDIHSKKRLEDHFDRAGIQIYTETGDAYFTDPYTIETVNGLTVQGRRFIVCVGGHARELPFPGAEHAMLHHDVWQLTKQPQSVVIVGGGATGCQLASVFEEFGSEVTLVDIAPRILMTEDESISEYMQRQFTRQGVDVKVNTEGIKRIENGGGRYRFIYGMAGEEYAIETDAVILSVGWPGNLSGLGLEKAGVETIGSYIKTDDYLQTSADHIYAAGDITGRMMLVQSASEQARSAVENALLNAHELARHTLVPHGGFTDPEYGGVGMTEAAAREDHDIVVATVPYSDLDRAVIDGREVGFCKLIVDARTHHVLGAHVVGEQAVEIVSMVSAGMAADMTIEQLADLQLAYPTFAAVVGLAAREITREIGLTPVAPVWRAIMSERAAEWERSTQLT